MLTNYVRQCVYEPAYVSGDTFAGNVGLALSQVLILCGMLQYGMRQTAETIARMTSVERILQFTELEKEGPFESNPVDKPSSNWPSKGEIKFDHVSLQYSELNPPVLKSLNFVIEPGMKVITQFQFSIHFSYKRDKVSNLSRPGFSHFGKI